MTQEEILHALKLVAMGRTNLPQVVQLAAELSALTPQELPAPGVEPEPEAEKPRKKKA